MFRGANRVLFNRATQRSSATIRQAATARRSSSSSSSSSTASKAESGGATKLGGGGGGGAGGMRRQANRAQLVTQLGGAVSQAVFLDLLLFGHADDDGT